MNLYDTKIHHCVYIIGEPREQQCCGVIAMKGTPYCPEHYRMCHWNEKNRNATENTSRL